MVRKRTDARISIWFRSVSPQDSTIEAIPRLRYLPLHSSLDLLGEASCDAWYTFGLRDVAVVFQVNALVRRNRRIDYCLQLSHRPLLRDVTKRIARSYSLASLTIRDPKYHSPARPKGPAKQPSDK